MRCLLVFLVSAAAAHAQLTRGSISGTVRDASNAVVVGADVSAREQSTGLPYRTVTNEAGVYRIAALEPGTYTIEFSKAGFENARHENIALDSAQEAVLNPVLAVAGTAASVTIDASAEGVSLSKASPVIERRTGHETLEALPMTGSRDVESVLLLTPGVTADGSANGQRVGQNISNLDGIDNVDPQFQYRTISISPEGAEEVHVRTSPYSAELGRGLGAQISLVGRRGTNRLRGEAWDFYNADWLSAPTLANKRAGLVQSRFVDHQAGAALGGPIRRNRTFFFALFQAMPHREGASANLSFNITIPTPSGYAALPAVPLAPGQTLKSRQAVLDAIGFLPEIHGRILRYDSIRTSPVNGVPIEFGTTRLAQARPGDYYRSQQRLDHRFSDRNTFSYFGSILTFDSPITRLWPFSNNYFGDRFASSESQFQQTHALSDTHVFGPSLLNETRVSFSRRTVELQAPNDTGVSTITSGFRLGASQSNPFIRPSNTHQAQDVLTWIRARHSIKFGADLIQVVDTLSSNKQHIYNFPGFEAFLNSQPTRLVVILTASNLSMRYLKQNYFVQDDFKLRPELTLNFGVRYQTSSVPRGYFAAATPQIAAAGVPGPLQRDTNDVAPRFGFGYSPQAASGLIHRLAGSGKSVFRGGFGIAYGLAFEGEGGTALSSSLNYPYYQELRLDTAQATNLYPGLPPLLPATSGFNPLLNFTNFRSDAKNQTTHFYSFSIQRQFGQNYFVELGYTGNRSYHLPFTLPVNRARLAPEQALRVVATRDPNSTIPSVNQRKQRPDWGDRNLNEISAYSRYHAGYVRFDRRFNHGFLVGANYTWSGAFSILDSDSRQPVNPDNLRVDYARSNLDRPHRFVVHYVWQIPGRRPWSGWRISGISQWQSGQPFTVTTGVDSNGDGTAGNSIPDRPDYNPAGLLLLDPATGNWRSFVSPLDGGRFVTPLNNSGLPLQYSMPFGGNLGRNTFRGPGFALWNLSLMKPFRFGERIQFEVRADATNAFNHRNFGPPVSNMSNPEFGRNASNPDSRAMLLGAKLRF